MEIRRLSQDVSVSPQITPMDVAVIAEAGFRSIVCNRPDGEEPGQPIFDEIAQEAKAHGLDVLFQPIVSGYMHPQDGDEFAAALDRLPKPVLAYCRSGTRCCFLWAMSQSGSVPSPDIQRAAAQAGYDVSTVLSAMGKR